MKHQRLLILAVFSLYFLFNLGWDGYLYTLPHTKAWGTTSWNYLYNVVYGLLYLFGGVVAVVYGFTAGIKSNLGKMNFFFGLGLVSLAIGNFIWTYYNMIAKISIPYPSWADLAYLLSYPLMYVGMFYLLMVYRQLLNKKLLRELIIVAVICMIIVIGFVSRPDLSPGNDLLQKILNVFYPLGDSLMIASAFLAVRLGGGKIHFSLYLLAVGLLLDGAGDILFTYRSNNNSYWNGDISDLTYTFCAYLISLGLILLVNALKDKPAVVSNQSPFPPQRPILPIPMAQASPESVQVLPSTEPAPSVQSPPQPAGQPDLGNVSSNQALADKPSSLKKQ